MNPVAADRDLLFGLLALQIGLIDQERLIASFRAWTRDKSRAMADYLADRGDLDADDCAAVEALVLRHLKKHGGSAEKSLAAIPAGPSTRESLARIGDPEFDGSLARLGCAPLTTQADASDDRTAAYSVGTATSDGMRFRVLRPHARGGLGAVFVALDGEFNREVALKQILDQHADDPVSRQRFVLEAEVTGSLEHPGIVPVYGLGTYADGRPFYAMRFIRGDSLKEAIDAFHSNQTLKNDPGRRSLELRKLLRRFTDVCNAIEYAHSRGVLHRDIKPGNIVVGKHGETLMVDWGLAKAVGRIEPAVDSGEKTLVPRSATGSSSTLPGSALGTPAYMSPEQAEGDLEKLGPRSDVYSLGATLYCIVTGKPPFEGPLVDVIQSVQKGKFPSPRELESSIDRALEAVCLKAMARRPTDRYSSPRALAEDLERWMADEAVTAWREPWTRTLARWLARHRVGVTATAAAVLVALAGTGAVLAVQTRANRELMLSNTDLAIANSKVTKANAELAASNERERARFALAQEAIRAFHTGVSKDILLKQAEFTALRGKLLRGASEFYQKLEGLLQGQEDRDSRLALGKAYYEVGELTRQLDSIDEAHETLRRASAVFESLARDDPADPEPRLALALNLRAIGIILNSTGRAGEGLAAMGRSRELLQALAEADQADLGLQSEWASAELYYGNCLVTNRRAIDEALKPIELARSILERAMNANPRSERLRYELAEAYGSLASTLDDAGRRDEALSAYKRSDDLSQSLFREHPEDPNISHDMARNLGNMAVALSGAGRPAESLVALERAQQVLKEAASANPTMFRIPATTAWIDYLAANNLVALGRDAEALEAFEKARAAREIQIKANPALTRNREQLIRVHRGISEIHRRAGRLSRALESLRPNAELAASLARDHPENRYYQHDFIAICDELGALAIELGKPAEAVAWLEKTLPARRKLVEISATTAPDRTGIASILREWALASDRCGRPAEAASVLRRAITLMNELAQPSLWDLYNTGCYQSLLSGVAAKAGSGLTTSEARAAADDAIKSLRRAIAAGMRDEAHAKSDPDLIPIRSHPEFQSVLRDMALANPFAADKPK